MIRSVYILILCLVACSAAVEAQVHPASNIKRKRISTTGAAHLDSLSTVPGSIIIIGFNDSFFELDPISAVLTRKTNAGVDSVDIIYRTFPFKLDAPAFRYDFDSIRKTTVFTPYVVQGRDNKGSAGSVFDFGDINYNGSFGRSLSFGNNQDAVFNSQLNLQMSGFIGDSIEIAAAITDNNIPIQPDGTTQQLNEFDKILLQFR